MNESSIAVLDRIDAHRAKPEQRGATGPLLWLLQQTGDVELFNLEPGVYSLRSMALLRLTRARS